MKVKYTGDNRGDLESGRIYKATPCSLGYEIKIAGKVHGILECEGEVVKDIEAPTPINPSHYTDGPVEVWEMMVDIWGLDKFITYCQINAFKYRMRAGKKEGNSVEQDIKKALWYEGKIKEIKSNKSFDSLK